MTDIKESAGLKENILGLLKQYVPGEKLVHERDTVLGRYRILVNQQLPELSSKFATAYKAVDNEVAASDIYALVYNDDIPIRKKHIEILKEFRHPGMVSVLESAAVEISTASEVRYVVILEKPVGQSVSNLLSGRKTPVSQAILTSYLLRPLVEVLTKLGKTGLSHNRINLNNVYIAGNNIMLGECISEPSGYSQDFLFEPIERILTSPLAKSDYSISADCYALAVMALHLSLGFKPFENISREMYIQDVLTKGSYHTLTMQWDFSSELQDFFRGLLNDARRERWDPESILSWLNGRQFNLIIPSFPNEGARGFECASQTYYNRKAVAHAIFREWQNAYILLSDNKLARWLETSVHKPDTAEAVMRLSGSISADNVHYERQNNELIARIVLLLDPAGPVRLKHLALMIDGIGHALTHAFLNNEHEDIQIIVQMLESDLPGFVSEQLSTAGQDYGTTLWKLQKVRGFIRMKGLGFGMERAIYELNPDLPCQSKLIKRYHVTTLQELMLALDKIAPQKAAQSDFMDRHIAGFIASKLEIKKEISINELAPLRNLATHSGLIGLKLLVRAENKISTSTPLIGLSYWVVLQLLPIADTIHKRSTRKEFQDKLMAAAATGLLRNIANLLLNPDIFITDHNDFHVMAAQYTSRKAHITELKNHTLLLRHSRIAGRGIAQTFSYGICLTVAYYTLKSYFHF